MGLSCFCPHCDQRHCPPPDYLVKDICIVNALGGGAVCGLPTVQRGVEFTDHYKRFTFCKPRVPLLEGHPL